MINVVDLFSGCGGMSLGFHRNNEFEIIGAVDRQNGKPSAGEGSLECNKSYQKNIGVKPIDADLKSLSPETISENLQISSAMSPDVDILISCAPCTGFSKTVRKNLVIDDPRNSLVLRTGEYVRYFRPKILIMENVGELLNGRFSTHFLALKQDLENQGYGVDAAVHNLTKFGLAQNRKRALILAVDSKVGEPKTLDDLWSGVRVKKSATTVRHAIQHLPSIRAGDIESTDTNHRSPANSQLGLERLRATPLDGGDWTSWVNHADALKLLIPSMKKQVAQGKVGPYRDVYGRMWWDRPSPTLKRECSHTGNGRYAHPEQNRLCSVREMSLLQGFPSDYFFVANNLSNMYRHIGDSVPPLISYQISKVCGWILSGKKPDIEDCILPLTTLSEKDLEEDAQQLRLTV